MKQRQNNRTSIGAAIEVINQANQQVLGNLCDLSPTGLMLVGDLCPQKGEQYHLLAVLPEQSSRISFQATCLWVKPGTVEDSFESGFILEEQTAELQRQFEELATAFNFFGNSENIPE